MSVLLFVWVLVLVTLGGTALWFRYGQSEPTSTVREVSEVPDFPPVPNWKPAIPVDISRTVATLAYYFDGKRAFAVLSHGTCILLPEGSEDPETDSKALLDKVYHFHPDFHPQLMDDGNFLVSYSQPVFSVVFQDEWETHRTEIDRHHLDALVRAEVLLNAEGQANQFDDIGKIGLFGRARMFLDAQTPVVVQIWRPEAETLL